MRNVIVAAAVVTSMVAFAHAQVVVVPPPPFYAPGYYAPGYMVYAPGFQPVPYGGYYVQSLHPAPIVNPYFADTPFYRSYYPAPIVSPYPRPPACRAFTSNSYRSSVLCPAAIPNCLYAVQT